MHNSKGSGLPSSISKERLKEAESLLGLKNYLEYAWFAQIKLPLRKIILGDA
jgi:hypothetical protein